MEDDVDPPKGWPIHEMMQMSLNAKHDIYGALYNYLRELLTTFCTRLQVLRINFFIYHHNPKDLIRSLRHHNTGQQSFDRIGVRKFELFSGFSVCEIM